MMRARGMARRALSTVGMLTLVAIGVIWWLGFRTEATSPAASGQLVPGRNGTRASSERPPQAVAHMRAATYADVSPARPAEPSLGYAATRSPSNGRLRANLGDTGKLVRASHNTTLVTTTD